ncbi:rCG62219 [Rattus norvegicus]|uniref:RCG62219 n=1 Tax=Rattus norvegicus TaxID=10116 RepID=A6HCI7_RAT|nr:rCG62219 [Rattus norvegicus]
MSVRFNSNGTQLLALRRRLPPVLYDIHSRLPVFHLVRARGVCHLSELRRREMCLVFVCVAEV